MDGFQYNGVHCSEFNVWYIPDEKARWFSSPGFEVYDTEVSGKDGGYLYGKRTKIRTFTQECFYEDIDQETRENIRNWLSEDGDGELIFDLRPLAVYYVTPTKVVDGTQYVSKKDGIRELYSGTFQVTFSAYKPFGYLKEKTYQDYDYTNAEAYCGILEESYMPAKPTTQSRSFLVYNPGTKPCDTVLKIGGSGTNLLISNATNGTKCAISSLPASGYLEIDSEIGTVYAVSGSSKTLDFSYHDEGYLTLVPYLPRNYGVIASMTSGSAVIALSNYVPKAKDVGRYIYLNGAWRKITQVNTGTITVSNTMTASGMEETKIVTMNEITISGASLTLTTLDQDYRPKII